MTQEEAIVDMMRKMTSATGKSVDESFIGTRSLVRIADPDARGAVDSMHAMHRRHRSTPEKHADRIELHQILDNPAYTNLPMQYEYDFGDCWEHSLSLLCRVDNATDFFQCIAGEGHSMAEDAGGVKGWEELKLGYRAQALWKEQKEKMRWFEREASNRDEAALGNGWERIWAKTKINGRLAELAGKVVSFT